MKKCFKCEHFKPLDLFYKHNGMTDGYLGKCKSCTKKDTVIWQKNNPVRNRELKKIERKRNKDRYYKWRLKTQYGISEERLNEMLLKQNNLCGICNKSQDASNSKKLYVDHDHSTGEIRGLLCASCNKGLGLFKDDKISLKNAIGYLERF